MSREDQDSFEAFYKDVRSGLLLQTYALTGDLQASEKAVRDAMVVAWHHWRKVSRLEDREEYVRPLAWSRALRRSQARWWSRMKGLDPEVAATLDALAKLPVSQRRVLLLSHLTSLPLEGISREVGISRTTAERELQTATAQFAVNRDVESTGIRPVLEGLRPQVDEVRWPRPSIITRAGSARRRTHTTFGAALAVAALVISGSLVTDAAGVRPSLDTKGVLEGAQPSPSPTTRPEPEPEQLTPESLLTADQVGAALGGTWTQGQTSGNTGGDGLVFTCQGGRYADPAGVAALVRTFKEDAVPNAGKKRQPEPSTAGQSVEVSADATVGQTTYQTTAGWYAGCMAPRMQLLTTHRVKGVAAVLEARDPSLDPEETRRAIMDSADQFANLAPLSASGGRLNAAGALSALGPDTRAPAAPSGLTATGVAGQVSLEWLDNEEEDVAGYRVYATSGPTVLAETSVSAGVLTGAATSYQVTAFDQAGNESATLRAGGRAAVAAAPCRHPAPARRHRHPAAGRPRRRAASTPSAAADRTGQAATILRARVTGRVVVCRRRLPAECRQAAVRAGIRSAGEAHRRAQCVPREAVLVGHGGGSHAAARGGRAGRAGRAPPRRRAAARGEVARDGRDRGEQRPRGVSGAGPLSRRP